MTILLHTCGFDRPGALHAHHAPDTAESGSAQAVHTGTGRKRAIDLHCHLMVGAIEQLVADAPQKKGERDFLMRMQGEASTLHNAKMFAAMANMLMDIDTRLRDMDAMGVDIQVLSPSPGQYYYWAEPDLAGEIVRLQNTRIAEAIAKHPDRFLGLGGLALQHAELAIKQLEHAVRELGFKGVQISTAVNGVDLTDDRFNRFWARAEELRALVFIHPLGTSLGERVNMNYLTNIVGQPLETTIALSKLIFSGMLDRHPDLKLLAAHGGGYLPAYIGRSDHGYMVRPEAQGIQHKPSEYLKRIYFDDLVFTPQQIKNLIAQVGISQVVVGTDYPFDMGQYDVQQIVSEVAGLSEAEREMILSGNASRLLAL